MREPTNNPPPLAALLTTLAISALIVGLIVRVAQ